MVYLQVSLLYRSKGIDACMVGQQGLSHKVFCVLVVLCGDVSG